MNVTIIILITVLTHTSYKGSKVLISLYALELGANPLLIGLLFSMYSIFPIVLSIYAGKLSDRFGARPSMLVGACGLFLGLVLPFLVPRLEVLYVSAMLIGLTYIFYIVSVQSLIGSIGDATNRTRNYSLFALGVGVTAMLGPMITGFSIDGIGHRYTYLLLALLPLIPVAVLLMFRRLIPRPRPREQKSRDPQRLMDLFKDAPLRRVLITGGIIETGLELVNFFLPIYARTAGISASQIGIIMGSYGVALLGMRAIIPWMVKHASEQRLIFLSLLFAAGVCTLFPFVSNFGLLVCLAFLLGIGLGSGSPLSMILVYNYAPPERSGEAIGLRQSINKTAETVMPLLFGFVATFAGPGAVFWLTALMISVGSTFMHSEAVRRARKLRA
jgi:MFS family permease